MGVYSIQQFTEIDKGKQSEEDGREVGNHVHGEVTLNACMIVEENDTDNESKDKPDGIFFPVALLEDLMPPAQEPHVKEHKGFGNSYYDEMSGERVVFADNIDTHSHQAQTSHQPVPIFEPQA